MIARLRLRLTLLVIAVLVIVTSGIVFAISYGNYRAVDRRAYAALNTLSRSRERPAEPVPLQIRNATTKLMQEAGYNKGYQYAHDTAEKLTRMQCLPDSLAGRRYYLPTEQGRESRIKERLDEILAWKAQK